MKVPIIDFTLEELQAQQGTVLLATTLIIS